VPDLNQKEIIECVRIEPPKDFATTCVNLHQIKYIFTHTQSHVFQMMF